MSEAPHFDRLAGAYRWLEWASFGPWLRRCRRGFLPRLGAARRALVLGDGDGRFTAALLRRNRQIRVHAIDLSPAMLRSLRQNSRLDSDRVQTQVADARQWTPDTPGSERFDLVATHFFLDCLTTAEVRDLAARIRPWLTPDALWVVSEFAVPQGGFGRWIARPLVGALYRAFGLLTGLRVRRLPDHHAALEAAGFLLGEKRLWLRGLLVSEIWTPNAPL